VRRRPPVASCQNPLDVGVLGRVQLGQGVTSPVQNPSSHVPLDVAEEARIATEPPHHGPREEHPEHRPPPPCVPCVAVERLPLFASAAGKQASDDRAGGGGG